MMDAEKISRLRIEAKDQDLPRKRFRWRYAVAVCVLLALCAASSVLYTRGVFTPSIDVRVAPAAMVYPSQTVTEFNASGYVVPQLKASVASKGTGRIEYLGVKEGSSVKAGDVLARLDSEDLKAERAQIEAQLAAARADLARMETDRRTAERNFKRYANLVDRQVVSQSAFESAQDQSARTRAQVESATANIKALEAGRHRLSVLIGYTVIRAPFDGVVLTKDADVGEVVAPFGSALNAKAAVLTMADLSSLMVQADVAESFLSRVKEGQACEIQLDALPQERFSGKVATIVPTADRTRGTVLVKVRFDCLDSRILPEMSARVAFLTRPLTEGEARPFLAVHRDALTHRQGVAGLFQFREGRAQWVPLPSAEQKGDYVVLPPSLQAGDSIVLRPEAAISQASKIKISE